MTKVINLFGAPSAGKSATASRLFGWMKTRGYSVEFVEEKAKPLVITKSSSMRDGLFLFAVQNHAIYNYVNEVEFIVTDSPVALSIPYLFYPDRNDKYDCNLLDWKFKLKDLILDTYSQYDNINFFIKRDMPYETFGRNESSEQSLYIEGELVNLLEQNQIPYMQTKTSESFEFCSKYIESAFPPQ